MKNGVFEGGKILSPDVAQKRCLKSTRRRQLQIAIALKDYADMTGSHPDITAEAVVRLRREGMLDCGHLATLQRFRELIDNITNQRARAETKNKEAETWAQSGHMAFYQS